MSTRPAVRPNAFGDALVMIGHSVTVARRTPAAVLSATFLPIILLLTMTASFAKIVSPNGSYADYVNWVLPLLVVMGVMFSSLTTGIAAHQDLHSGLDDRLRTLPMARSAPLVGRIVGDAVRNFVTVVVVVALGIVLGFRFDTSIFAIIGFFVVPLVFGVGFAWLAVTVGIRAATAENVESWLSAGLLVLSFLSTGFVAKNDLPGWVQPIAEVNPVSSVVEAMRALAHGGATAGPLFSGLAWSAGLTAVFSVLAVRTYRRRARR
ncbi:MAG: ABC transporter permease [Pseudonocardiaceae bacterium]